MWFLPFYLFSSAWCFSQASLSVETVSDWLCISCINYIEYTTMDVCEGSQLSRPSAISLWAEWEAAGPPGSWVFEDEGKTSPETNNQVQLPAAQLSKAQIWIVERLDITHWTNNPRRKLCDGVTLLPHVRIFHLANVLLAMMAHFKSGTSVVVRIWFMCDKNVVQAVVSICLRFAD